MPTDFNAANLGSILSGSGTSRQVSGQLGGGKGISKLIADPFFRTGAGEAFGLVGQHGAMDPKYLNAILGQIQRNTAGDTDAFRTGAVQAGLGGSGVAQAIQAAIQNAGAQRQYQAVAEEGRLAEDRYRGDLDRLMGLLGLGRQDIAQQNQMAAQRAQQRAATKMGYINAATSLAKAGATGGILG